MSSMKQNGEVVSKSFVDCTLAQRHMYVDSRTLYVSQQQSKQGMCMSIHAR